jgi:hypothetical protein
MIVATCDPLRGPARDNAFSILVLAVSKRLSFISAMVAQADDHRTIAQLPISHATCRYRLELAIEKW